MKTTYPKAQSIMGHVQVENCLRLDDYHVAGGDVDTLPLLFNPMEKLVF